MMEQFMRKKRINCCFAACYSVACCFTAGLFLLISSLVITGCDGSGQGSNENDTRITLGAAGAVTARAYDTEVDVEYNGTNIPNNLESLDFTVSGNGAAVRSVSIIDIYTAIVTITFPVNFSNVPVTYTVGINPASTRIKGIRTATVTQGIPDQETRVALIAGPGVDANAAGTSALVTFVGADNLALNIEDFVVDNNAAITNVQVNSGTVTITITFSQNNSQEENYYTVGIFPRSDFIWGSAKVTVTQSFAGDTRPCFTAAQGVINVSPFSTTTKVDFTSLDNLSGITLSLSKEDFTVTGGAVIDTVVLTSSTAAVTVAYGENDSYTNYKNFTVGLARNRSIRGGTTVVIIQEPRYDARVVLTAGEPITVSATETAAVAEFTFTGETPEGALGSGDFAVSGGAQLGTITIDGETISVPISFSANDDFDVKNYIVSIRPTSTLVRGNTTVTITQAAPPLVLPLVYEVNEAGTAFTGSFGDGRSTVTELGGNAAFRKVNGVNVVATNTNGFVSLGRSAGEALRTQDTWSIEVIVYLDTRMALGDPNVSPQIFGIGVGESGAAGPGIWATVAPSHGRLFQIRPNGWSGGFTLTNVNLFTGRQGDENANITPNTRGQWRHFVFTFGDAASRKMDVNMDGVLIMDFVPGAAGKPWLSTRTMPLMPIAYLGKPFNWGAAGTNNANAAMTTNSFYHSFIIYAGYKTAEETEDMFLEIEDLLDTLNEAE